MSCRVKNEQRIGSCLTIAIHLFLILTMLMVEFGSGGGDGKAGGPTGVRLIAHNANECQVRADTDSDSRYSGAENYNSGIILWTDL